MIGQLLGPVAGLASSWLDAKTTKQAAEAKLKLTEAEAKAKILLSCLLYTSPSPRDVEESRMPSSA